MKLRLTTLLLFSTLYPALMVVPVSAGTLYNNGPDPGDIGDWSISGSNSVANSFAISGSGNSTVTAVLFSEWVQKGDTPTTVNWAFTSAPFGGTQYASGLALLTILSSFTNSLGFTQNEVTFSITPLVLGPGNYWFQLQDAATMDFGIGSWGQNSGVGCNSPGCPSVAFQNQIGKIGSESFAILGEGQSTTPEPNSIALLGSGVLALAGGLRRKRTP